MQLYEIIFQIRQSINGVLLLIIAAAFSFIAYAVMYPDKLMILNSMIAGLFKGISAQARKSYVANRIRGHTIKAVKKLNSEGLDILPPDLKIVWVKDEDREAFFKNNQVIIRMRKTDNPHENFVNAITAFVSSSLLKDERLHFDSKVMQAADISVINKLVIEATHDSLRYFKEKINYLVENDDELKNYIEEIIAVDGNGMFINILLNEFMKAGRKKHLELLKDPGLIAESKEFLSFLFRIANGVYNSPDDWVFDRDYFKVAIVFAARTDTYELQASTPYVNAIKKRIDEGIEAIYVFGLGQKIKIAKDIAKLAMDEDMRIIDRRERYYHHKSLKSGARVRGVCIEIIADKISL